MSELEREHEALLRLYRVAVGLLSDIKLNNHIENYFDSRKAWSYENALKCVNEQSEIGFEFLSYVQLAILVSLNAIGWCGLKISKTEVPLHTALGQFAYTTINDQFINVSCDGLLDADGSKVKVEIPHMPSSKVEATEKTKQWIELKQTTHRTVEVTFPSFDMKFCGEGLRIKNQLPPARPAEAAQAARETGRGHQR